QLLAQVEEGRKVLSLAEVFPSATGTVRLPSPYVFETRGPDGEVQSTYPERYETWPRVGTDPDVLTARASEPYTVRGGTLTSRWRVLIEPLSSGEFLVIAASLTDVDAAVERLSHLNLLIGMVVLGAAALIAVAVVWLSLRPLGEIERTAAAIAAGDLSRRVPDRDPRTEVGRLARVLNMTFNQIETAFRARVRSEAAARRSEERMRRFVADAGHELRSPLTSIRGFAELHRHGAISDPEETGAVMRRIEDEASRMGLLVEDLLLLARLDQHRPIAWEPVDLLELAVDAVTAARAVAPDRPIELVVGGGTAGGPPVVMGDQARLRQVLDNLVRNALIHTPSGTRVEVRVRAEAPNAILEVADNGPGLDEDQAERVFERFYRADPGRSRRHGSSGLGLAIVAALATAHGGRAGVITSPGAGAAFWVRLPLAPEAVQHPEPESAASEVGEPTETDVAPTADTQPST
ncbi:MAG TPA: HAMP domain-containing sensor histidine kinase, partial [Micromonosporaceae bacterium]|nr:HAMP domain-containing sensor histidine kinase [Micromonosporaceae bacterium]